MAQLFKKQIVFFVMFVAPVMMSFFRKFESLYSLRIVGYIDDIALILLLPLAFRGVRFLLSNRHGNLLLMCYFLFLCAGCISGILENVSPKQMIFQLMLEVKLPMMVCIMLGLKEKKWYLQTYFNFSKYILLGSLPLIFWQLLGPDSYHSFFVTGADKAMFHLPGGNVLERCAGIFWFPGELAFYSGIAFIYFFFRWQSKRSFSCNIWMLLALLVLLSSMSRLEVVGTFFGVMFSLIMSVNQQKKKIMYGQYILLLIPTIMLLIPLFRQSYEQLQLYDIANSNASRVVFYYYSVVLAGMFFPFGAGLGTYGGQAALLFDSNLYHQLGFDMFWWFRMRIYLNDTFWPHILGESGIVGIFFYLCFLYILWRVAVGNLKFARRPEHFFPDFFEVSRIGVAVCCWVFIDSFAEPIFYSMRILPILLFLVYGLERRNQVSQL